MRLAGACERLRCAPDVVQHLAQVGGRGRDVVQVPAPPRRVERVLQRGDALVDLADRGERDAERVDRARGVEVGGALVGQLGLLGDRAARHLDRAVIARLQHQHPGLAGEQPGALGARAVVGQEREAVLECRDRLVGTQQRPQRALERSVQPRGAPRLGGLVDERERTLRERRRAMQVVGVEGRRGCLLQQGRLVGAREGRGVRDAVPQLQRALEQGGSLAVGVDGDRGVAGAHRGGERGRLITRGVVVVGDRGRALRAAVLAALGVLLQRAGERPVQLGALTRQEVVVDRLAQQRVAEPVAIALGHDDVAQDGLAQRLPQGTPVEPGDLGQHGVVELAARREHAHDLLRVVAEPLDPQRERGGEARRQRAEPVESGREQLLGEQRVPLAAGVEPVDEARIRGRREDLHKLLGELVAAECGKVDPQRAHALELGQERAQRVAPVQLVGPVGGDEQQRLVAERRGEEAQERARRRVGPVQVLDDQQHGRGAGERLQHREQRLEHPRLVAGRPIAVTRLAEPRQERAQLGQDVRRQRLEHRIAVAHERPQRGDQRRVGELALAELDAVAAQHAGSLVRCAGLELLHEAALADARLPDDERERRLPRGGVRQGRLQLRELERTAHQSLRCHSGRHTLQDRRAGGCHRAVVRSSAAGAAQAPSRRRAVSDALPGSAV